VTISEIQWHSGAPGVERSAGTPPKSVALAAAETIWGYSENGNFHGKTMENHHF